MTIFLLTREKQLKHKTNCIPHACLLTRLWRKLAWFSHLLRQGAVKPIEPNKKFTNASMFIEQSALKIFGDVKKIKSRSWYYPSWYFSITKTKKNLHLWLINVRNLEDLKVGKTSFSRKRGFASINFFSSINIMLRAVLVSPYFESCSFSLKSSNQTSYSEVRYLTYVKLLKLTSGKIKIKHWERKTTQTEIVILQAFGTDPNSQKTYRLKRNSSNSTTQYAASSLRKNTQRLFSYKYTCTQYPRSLRSQTIYG